MGKSLNDMLYEGTDPANSLVGVLSRYRENRISVMTDIKSMFKQVLVPDCDSSFPYCGKPTWTAKIPNSRTPLRSRFVLGSRIFTLRKTAEDNQHSFPPSVINTVKRNFYVVDRFQSLPSEADAIQHIDNLRVLLSRGGFKITKWISNSRNVVETIPELERRTSRTLMHARMNFLFCEPLKCNVAWSPTHFTTKSE